MKKYSKSLGMSAHRKSMSKGNHNSKVKQQVSKIYNDLHKKHKVKFDKLDTLKNLDS